MPGEEAISFSGAVCIIRLSVSGGEEKTMLTRSGFGALRGQSVTLFFG